MFEGVETHVRPKDRNKPNVTFKVLFSKITVLEGCNITGWTLENAPRTQLTARATSISPLASCFPETELLITPAVRLCVHGAGLGSTRLPTCCTSVLSFAPLLNVPLRIALLPPPTSSVFSFSLSYPSTP